MSFQIIISLGEHRTGLFIHSNGCFHPNEVIPLWCDIFTSLMKKVRDYFLLQEGSRTYSPNVTLASQNEVIHLWCNSRLSFHWRQTKQDYLSTGMDLSIKIYNSSYPLELVLMEKARDFVFLQECFNNWRIWQRYSPNATPASQNEVINLWCDSRFSSHWRNDRTGLVIHKNGYFYLNTVNPVWCYIFTSLMRKE